MDHDGLNSGTLQKINGEAPQGVAATKRTPLDNPFLAEHAVAIRALGKQTAENIVEIGRRLVECRDRHLDHGQWLPWLEREFQWSRQTADNFIHVYEARAKLPKFGNLSLPLSGLYLLTAPSTPEPAKTEIIERAEAGESLPVAEVKRVVKRHKGTKHHKQPTTPPPPPPAPTPARNDIGATSADNGVASTGEVGWLKARNEELENKCRLLELKIEGLESENSELKAENVALRVKLEVAQKAAAASPKIAATDTVTAGDPGPIPEFLQRKPAAAGTSESGGDVTPQDAVANAFDEIEDLACGCRGQVDNAPAVLDQSARIQALDETAGVLESLSMPDVPAALGGIKVKLPKPRRLRSRGAQRDAALGIISACAEALDAIDESDPRHQEANDFCSELQSASSELEGCEFS